MISGFVALVWQNKHTFIFVIFTTDNRVFLIAVKIVQYFCTVIGNSLSGGNRRHKMTLHRIFIGQHFTGSGAIHFTAT